MTDPVETTACAETRKSCLRARLAVAGAGVLLLLAIWSRAELAGDKAFAGLKEQGKIVANHLETGAAIDARQTARIVALEAQGVRVLKKLDTIESLLRGQRK